MGVWWTNVRSRGGHSSENIGKNIRLKWGPMQLPSSAKKRFITFILNRIWFLVIQRVQKAELKKKLVTLAKYETVQRVKVQTLILINNNITTGVLLSKYSIEREAASTRHSDIQSPNRALCPCPGTSSNTRPENKTGRGVTLSVASVECRQKTQRQGSLHWQRTWRTETISGDYCRGKDCYHNRPTDKASSSSSHSQHHYTKKKRNYFDEST